MGPGSKFQTKTEISRNLGPPLWKAAAGEGRDPGGGRGIGAGRGEGGTRDETAARLAMGTNTMGTNTMGSKIVGTLDWT